MWDRDRWLGNLRAAGKLTPHQRIIKAADENKGLRLSADECFYLSLDDAISTRAEHDDEVTKFEDK